MKIQDKLPVVSRKKKIDLKKFEALAKRVRKSFEEENKYREEKIRNGNNNPTRFSFGY